MVPAALLIFICTIGGGIWLAITATAVLRQINQMGKRINQMEEALEQHILADISESRYDKLLEEHTRAKDRILAKEWEILREK